MYLTLKSIHISLVAVSLSIFLIRGILMLIRKGLYRHRIFRIIPPMVDTVLLGTGVALMMILHQYPTNQPWLMVKLTALLVYILSGTVALNRVNNYRIQISGFVLALLTAIFMLTVARTHHPLGALLYLTN